MRVTISGAALTALALAIAACAREASRAVPTAEVTSATFEARVQAAGELKPAQATPVELPPTLRGLQRIVWLAPEGQEVRQGDPLARLDDEQILQDIAAAQGQLRTLEASLEAKRGELEQQKQALASELSILLREQSDAAIFAPADEELFSRAEIIDHQIDLELIGSKLANCRTRQERYTQRSEAEMEILRLKQRTEHVKLGQLEQTRNDLVIRAPHDGVFVPGRVRRDEKVRVGLQLWAGEALGELPDLTRMEAKVWVLESEAGGLAAGSAAEVTVDAHPSRLFVGRVKGVQPVANPIEEGSPVKYFEALLSLDETDPAIMAPGSRVRATISVAHDERVVAVPSQAIFHQGEETWCWVVGGARLEKRGVSVGRSSTSRTIVTDGLTAGERVALVDPKLGT